ncbi:MAG: DUF4214 domain-containing protein [Nitrosomonas sp.]|uniref:DUF4214 domain-containing protein n=1 Tax=Nitrosomonas sp. TaxID=42353 RepID=UPI002ABAA513|nr:DUF4214 domain-containing protein [Nitrosomonas sp.]MDZ4106581.1 DUF4214 domain-containing protein [Nitrosomonas sp.]
MTTTNFDSGSLVTNDGVTSATYSGWTFGASSAIDFANASAADLTALLNQSGGRSIILNYNGANVTDFYFKSSDGSDFQLNSFKIDNGPNGASSSLTIAGYRDGALIVAAESVNLTSSDAAGNISYTQQDNAGAEYSGLLAFNSAFNNVDEIRFVFGSLVELTVDDIDISAAVVPPTITSATYDASTNSLVVTGTNMTATSGALNDIDVSKLTLTGQGGATYTLTSSNVELDSATQFTVALNATDQTNVEGLLNKNGTSSVGATTYNIAAAADWNPAQTGNADATGNAITVSNVQTPVITSATYDASTGSLTVTGSNLVKASGATNDIDASKLTFTGEGSATYTLTDSADVEITSGTAFTVTLSSTDKAAVNQIINKNGTSSTGATTYNLAAADDWNTVIGNTDISDATGNGITVSNVAAPTITSATYDASTGALVVTGTGFLNLSGATNDIDVSKFTFTGEGGTTYTLTDSADVEITSGTAFTVTLSSTDKSEVNQIVNKNGTSSTGATTYNLAAAEDWAAGADASVNVVDATGNGITASNVATPAITSATYDASTGTLIITGTGFLKSSGAANDIDVSKFTFTGEGGTTYTLTDSADVEITSGTAFTVTLSSTDKAAVNQMINKNGTSSTSGTTYNLAAAEDWAAGASAAVTVADLTGNGITTSNVAAPAMTSATYDYNSNVLTVTGTGFLQKSGASNDIDLSKLTITGEGGATYTLTTATNIEITSGTSFSVTLTGADLINVETLLNKNGTSAVSSTTYNLAGAEDWAAGADAAATVADLTGNGITVSNYAAPAITSATFDASTNVLTVTGTDLVSNSGAANDVTVSLLTLTGEGGSYTLTSSAVDVTSATSFSVTLNAADQLVVRGLLNKDGTASSGATTYNVAAAEDWMAGSAASIAVADLTGNGITVSNVQTPAITSATYDSDSGILVVTGTNLFNKAGANNDIDISTLTLTGGTASATYTITSASDVEITSATSFSVTLSGADKTSVDALLDQTGTTSSGGSTYNLAAADNWLAGANATPDISDATNVVTVSINPRITSATYDASSGALVVTGTNLQANGGGSDIDASKLTFTGEDSTTYTLTDSADVEITSGTAFTVTLSATDKAAINQIVNKNGTASTGGTTYNLAAADDWDTNVTTGDTSDASGNGITASNVAVPAITSATYNASTGALVVTGTGLLKSSGAANDIDASKFTFTGEGGATYTLTDSADVEITSGTAFTVTLSTTDKAAVNQIINKNGTASTDATTYNLAAAEDWAAGAHAAVNVVDATGNGITTSNVAVPAITSATYNASTGTLVVTGSGFLKASGAANDIDASKFTFTGEGGATYTLTDSIDIEITSGTAFTITLSSTDKTAVNLLLNKDGTASTDATTYNLGAAEDWAAGADVAVTVADLTSNGITATISVSSSGGASGGGGTSTTTTTIDGVVTQTTIQPDGTVVTTIPAITAERQDDPASLFNDYADIPVITNTAGDALLTASLPVGVGLSIAGQTKELSLTDAQNDLIQRIEQKTGVNTGVSQEAIRHAEDFLSSLAADEQVIVQVVTPTVSDNRAPGAPIVITGSNLTSSSKQILIIDTSSLPSGTVIQLDNVAFASIIGAVRVIGGSGENFVVGDNHNQFIVLGADDDILSGGGGDDTIGSLGGNDQTSGDAGNDIVYGGTGNDLLSGGTGNDRLNGGLGFDSAVQAGQLSDYRVAVHGNAITLTHSNGEIDTLTDVELVRFASGPSLAIAYSEVEAVAHHLAKTWLERDLTAAEGSAVQNWAGATPDDILAAFHSLPEALAFQDMTRDELLAGLETNPNIIRIDAIRDFIGGDEDNQGYLPLGLAMNADGGAGFDVLRMLGNRDDVHLEFVDNRLELTQLSDGAMFSIKSAEMITFDNNETVVIAHNQTEGILARLVHSFFNRDATAAEWQLGRETLQQPYDPDAILDWFQQRAGLQDLSDTDYVQTIYTQTLGRSATGDELDLQLSRLESNQVDRNWLPVEIAQSSEAVTHLIGSVLLQDGWV